MADEQQRSGSEVSIREAAQRSITYNFLHSIVFHLKISTPFFGGGCVSNGENATRPMTGQLLPHLGRPDGLLCYSLTRLMSGTLVRPFDTRPLPRIGVVSYESRYLHHNLIISGRFPDEFFR
jgi:hypothetical protein